MSWLTKTLSIFNWKSKESEENKIQPVEKQDTIQTVGQLKSWITKELPPLAWERINMRIASFTFEKFGMILLYENEKREIPELVMERIRKTVKELYNKELN
jgi:hypothetical protein